ncbi:MAG: 5'-nucleotidase, lipoprotein e(P4) family [Planctomycetes bacterium]|nr:5'-nucleotidase, lipoprotein e(P4) family [Planctomycetota bacterium]
MRKTIILLLLAMIIVAITIFLTLFIANPSAETTIVEKSENLNATLWVQTSVEYKMLAKMAYKLAEEKLSIALDDKNWSALDEENASADLPPAIILDIDETVLDNSPFQARLVQKNILFNTDLWDEWVTEAQAEIIPGALEFIKFAKSKGVAVFYVTNRLFKNEQATFENLKSCGFPVESIDELLMKKEKDEWGSDKTSRREFIAEKYRILMLLGDDMNDFVFLGKVTPVKRLEAAEKYTGFWGKSWIILPNPAYGNWERSTYGYDYKLSEKEIVDKKLNLLITKHSK